MERQKVNSQITLFETFLTSPATSSVSLSLEFHPNLLGGLSIWCTGYLWAAVSAAVAWMQLYILSREPPSQSSTEDLPTAEQFRATLTITGSAESQAFCCSVIVESSKSEKTLSAYETHHRAGSTQICLSLLDCWCVELLVKWMTVSDGELVAHRYGKLTLCFMWSTSSAALFLLRDASRSFLSQLENNKEYMLYIFLSVLFWDIDEDIHAE